MSMMRQFTPGRAVQKLPEMDRSPCCNGEGSSGAHSCRLSLPQPCRHPAPCGLPCDLNLGPERHAVLEMGSLARLAVMILPASRGSFHQQAEELFAQLHCLVTRRHTSLTPTTMMVFLQNGGDETECRRLVGEWFGEKAPVTTYVTQPPCCGAALGVELWAWGGPGATVVRHSPHVIAAEFEGIRWIHCGGIRGASASDGPHAESLSAFREMDRQLQIAGVSFDQVVRTWLYVNQITDGPPGSQRYQELNRARTEFFHGHRLCHTNRAPGVPEILYPASTGIGAGGGAINMCCLALDTSRPDVFILPLENPLQTAACDYHVKYSPQSPKFARAMAVVQGRFVTTLVSGTASIVDEKTMHPGDAVRQTEQTLRNIETLISAENFTRHGLSGGGATMRDIAKLRVYVKRPEDYEKCRAVCEQVLPGTPVIYLLADVCRPDLLVEIEAVAFSDFPRRHGSQAADDESPNASSGQEGAPCA